MRSLQQALQNSSFDPTAFDPTAERPRLVALCRRWIGDGQTAEDLAQEAILIALRHARQGKTPAAWQPYLVGIARRLCANYQRRQRQENVRSLALEEAADGVPDPFRIDDPLDALLRCEREELVERALRHLKAPMRELLMARYMEDLPLSEIAVRAGISENAAAVRVHRGREALERILTTVLRTEAALHCLLPDNAADGWRETPLFCPRCGVTRLEGRFITESCDRDFALRCPTCIGQLIGMTTHAASLRSDAILGGVSGFRPGLSRVNHWWQGYLSTALEKRRVPCVRCGREASVRLDPGATNGLAIECTFCQETTFYITPTGLLFHSDALQEFWRRHPKIQNRNERTIVCEGRPAILATFAERGGNACVEVAYDRATLLPMRITTSG